MTVKAIVATKRVTLSLSVSLTPVGWRHARSPVRSSPVRSTLKGVTDTKTMGKTTRSTSHLEDSDVDGIINDVLAKQQLTFEKMLEVQQDPF